MLVPPESTVGIFQNAMKTPVVVLLAELVYPIELIFELEQLNCPDAETSPFRAELSALTGSTSQ
jgi:hypothetical protein